MQEQYKFSQRMAELYQLLLDEKSRTLFWDRLKCDAWPCLEHVTDLYADAFDLEEEQRKEQKALARHARELHASGQKLLLYGAGGCGVAAAEIMAADGIPFAGFCDRRAKELGEVCGKPVYSPEYLFSHTEECYVIVTASVCFDEINKVLAENHFPQTHILPYLGNRKSTGHTLQYFEFPELFRHGTAFVDGGCYDAADSIIFSKLWEDNYTKIFAFEPDEKNRKVCQKEAQKAGLHDFILIPAGLSKTEGSMHFMANHTGGSYFLQDEEKGQFFRRHTEAENAGETVQLTTLDSTVKEETVGFIKMDIEGAELDALIGAQQTLVRDQPLLAICVYHRQGDLLAIMDYLHTVVPEYRFYIRHYAGMQLETVLYATVPSREAPVCQR